jgi:hypothetical protein
MLAPGTQCLWLVSPCVVSFSTRNRISAVIIIFMGILSLLGLPHTKNSAVSCMHMCVLLAAVGMRAADPSCTVPQLDFDIRC